MNPSNLRISHVQPIAFDIFGHKDQDWGTKVKYFLPNMAAAQAKLGHKLTVHLLTSSKAHSMNVRGVSVHFHTCVQLPRSMSVTARYARQLSLGMVLAIRRDEADVIHLHGINSIHLMAGAVAWRARQQNISIVGQDHGPRQGWLPETLAHRYSLRTLDGVLAANAGSIKTLLAEGVANERIHIVPNGIDSKLFYPALERAREAYQPFRILVVSRLWEDKDPLTMADGVSELVRSSGHPIQLTVVGQGVLKVEVEARLKASGVSATFIEHMSQEELSDLYRTSDVLLLTSLREGWNQATLEAMACGLPVIATDIPGIRDGVANAGILIPTKSPKAVKDALNGLIENPEVRLMYSRLGLDRSRNFTWEAVAKQLQAIYTEIITKVHRSQHVPYSHMAYVSKENRHKSAKRTSGRLL